MFITKKTFNKWFDEKLSRELFRFQELPKNRSNIGDEPQFYKKIRKMISLLKWHKIEIIGMNEVETHNDLISDRKNLDGEDIKAAGKTDLEIRILI